MFDQGKRDHFGALGIRQGSAQPDLTHLPPPIGGHMGDVLWEHVKTNGQEANR